MNLTEARAILLSTKKELVMDMYTSCDHIYSMHVDRISIWITIIGKRLYLAKDENFLAKGSQLPSSTSQMFA